MNLMRERAGLEFREEEGLKRTEEAAAGVPATQSEMTMEISKNENAQAVVDEILRVQGPGFGTGPARASLIQFMYENPDATLEQAQTYLRTQGYI
jgi:hypothetical protein